MKSYALCPVSDKKINERVARLNGLFTVVLITVFLVTKNILPVIFLTADFFMRSFDFSRYSIIGISSRGIVRYFRLNTYTINAGPKIFAARIGLLFSALIVLFSLLNVPVPALLLAGILGLFSFLESAFGLCVACEIYPYIFRLLFREKFE